MCCLKAGNDQEQGLNFPGPIVWKSRVSLSHLGILYSALCVVQKRQLLNIPKISPSLNHRVYTWNPGKDCRNDFSVEFNKFNTFAHQALDQIPHM